jgi:hypothetical protein
MKKRTEPVATAARTSSYYQRQVAAGLVRVSTWIPKDGKPDLDAAVDKLYDKWTKDGLLV